MKNTGSNTWSPAEVSPFNLGCFSLHSQIPWSLILQLTDLKISSFSVKDIELDILDRIQSSTFSPFWTPCKLLFWQNDPSVGHFIQRKSSSSSQVTLDWVHSLAMLPNGWLASGSVWPHDQIVGLGPKERSRHTSRTYRNYVESLKVLKNGHLVSYSTDDNTLKIWNPLLEGKQSCSHDSRTRKYLLIILLYLAFYPTTFS